ncbi:penicillin-binding protein 1A [Chitinibacter fontanus]|uniref:Penicillin-binding protein 1A n=1 Tax=Chitinibacter fontanus TaxID=1737446 RepID=A0A7D5Z4D4_9NEIS|nr:penicillin-binding protein 1A [Chitinibacter fontanus]QLI81961.1 penicillin-binding protein 1A [Chitinibacter fontanus]
MTKKIFLICFTIFACLTLVAICLSGLAIAVTYPKLPSLEALTDYKPKVPLRVFTADKVLIGEFGEERRAFTPIDKVPKQMINALLAAEDERFYEHGGIDYLGVLRAIGGNLISGHARSGASTITMQVARNFYLSNEKTFSRKFNEALLSFKIEHNLSKDQILELYINQIYLGQRAYGFASAAQIYYGKSIDKLSIAEMAMLAGLPKAPSAYNPVVNPKRAKLRQMYVLRRMHELKTITDTEYTQAQTEQLTVNKSALQFPVHAEYVAEMVRQMMFERYKDAIYTEGYQVYTTIDSKTQQAAYDALRGGLIDYDTRHGYRGPEGFIDPNLLVAGEEEQLDEALSNIKDTDDLRTAVVIAADTKSVTAYIKGEEKITIQGNGLRFARSALSDKNAPATRIRPGAVIRIRATDQGWTISQLPQVEGALVALNPEQGAIQALVGGFDYNRNNFNHVTQAWRQPGSSFKPFIYSAALERGVTPSTLINDAPLVIDPQTVNGQKWEPKNYDGTYSGMTTVRKALTLSKNLVSIRILQAIGTDYAQQHITRFGFSPKNHPAYLTMALGAGSVTPLQMAEGYAVFANNGYRVRSYFIDRIEDPHGKIIAKTQPEIAGKNAPRTLDPRNAFIMTSMMEDVIKMGTATKAKVLGRNDLAGKTGTTNDAFDAWFAGFNPNLVAITWIGFDQPRSLGARETGGAAALPVWVKFMSTALNNIPENSKTIPEGVTSKTIETEKGVQTEYYLQEYPNTNSELGLGGGGGQEDSSGTQPLGEIKELLF